MTRVNFLAYIKRVFKRTDKDTEIYEALNETIRDVASRANFPEYSFQSYTPCVDAQEDYPIPTDLLHIDHPVRLLDGTGTNDDGYSLKHLSKEEYDVREPNPNRTSPSTGKPTAYCIYANSILLTPIPDDTYLVEINWGKVPTSLDDDSDTSAFMAMWDEVMKHGSLWRLFAGVGMYKPDADYWEARYEAGINLMKSGMKDKQKGWVSTGKVNEL